MRGLHLVTIAYTATSGSMTTPQGWFGFEVTDLYFFGFYLELERRRRCAREQHTALQKRSLLQLCQLKSSLTRLASKTSQNRARKNKIKEGLYFRKEA